MTEEKKGDGSQWFLPDLVGKKVTIRLMDGRPLPNVTLCAFNPYEIKVEVGRGKRQILFKHGIMSIEYDEAVQQERPKTSSRGR